MDNQYGPVYEVDGYCAFPLDLNRSRLLDIHVGCYQHFPRDLPEADIHPLCETCGNWDFGKGEPVKPFFVCGSVAAFLCPVCGNLVVDDYQGGKAGITHWLSRKQFRERFGFDAPEVPACA